MDLEQKAIKRIQFASELSLKHYNKPLVCTYSGGKDSDVMLELFRRAGIPFAYMGKVRMEMKNNNYTSFFKTKPKKVERYIRCRKCGGNMEWVEYYPPEIKCPKCGYTVYPKPYEPNCNEIEN